MSLTATSPCSAMLPDEVSAESCECHGSHKGWVDYRRELLRDNNILSAYHDVALAVHQGHPKSLDGTVWYVPGMLMAPHGILIIPSWYLSDTLVVPEWCISGIVMVHQWYLDRALITRFARIAAFDALAALFGLQRCVSEARRTNPSW